ncbi:MAG TPA: hypothetical protein VLZ78_05340 [Terrimesophilobacter sp.]|nr:hypothetical protein [Terrimesophilobacter sp.]
MAGIGRISLNIDSPLRTMLLAVRQVPADVRKQINAHTKREAGPIWTGEVRERAATRLQQRVLVDTSRVGVTDRNVALRSATVGTLRKGVPVSRLASGTEFGMNPGKQISTRSRKGKPYKRQMGSVFPRPRRGGYVVYPAARDAIPRVAALWVQTAVRTILDAFDGKN